MNGADPVLGSHGELDLEVGIGQTAPVKPLKAVRTLPGAEGHFDPGSFPVDCAALFGHPALLLWSV